MTRTQIKIFHDSGDKEAEQQANDWLETHLYKIIDIKFQVTAHGYNAVMVIYEQHSA